MDMYSSQNTHDGSEILDKTLFQRLAMAGNEVEKKNGKKDMETLGFEPRTPYTHTGMQSKCGNPSTISPSQFLHVSLLDMIRMTLQSRNAIELIRISLDILKSIIMYYADMLGIVPLGIAPLGMPPLGIVPLPTRQTYEEEEG